MAKQIRGNRNRTGKFRSQKDFNRPRNTGRNVTNKPKGIVKKRPIKTKANQQDARQKIGQKKRLMVDARDILAKKGKIQDARSKLDKIRNGRDRPIVSKQISTSPKVKVIGSHILQKTDRNGKISLVTNKSKNSSTHPSNMNLAIRKQLGLIPSSRPQLKYSPPKKSPILKNTFPIRKTIVNDIDYGMAVSEAAGRYSSGLYKWVKQPDIVRSASHVIGSLEPTRQAMRDVMREELLLARNSWSDYAAPKPLRLQPTGYVDLDAVDEDEEMPYAHPSRISLHGSTRVSNVHSRLDSTPHEPVSHGILSQAKTKVVVPAGHRIVVSNLHSSVIEDDIKELFEDIGQLLSAKLVRPGVAEVIYRNLKDAQKAVDTYHNRQLDGQPMKCLLVNKRPMNQATGIPLTKTEGFLGRKTIPSSESSNKLMPDISTIHKVLFQRK